MKTCSNGTSLWKPSTKASLLFRQRNTEAAGAKEAEGKRQREREEGKGEGERGKQIEEVEQEGVRGGGSRKRGDR